MPFVKDLKSWERGKQPKTVRAEPYPQGANQIEAIMVYDYERLVATAIEAIKKYKLVNTGEVSEYLPCHHQTALRRGVYKDERVQDALFKTRTKAKTRLRRRWEEPDAPAQLQLAAYKLMADPEEQMLLGTHHKKVSQHEERVTVTVQFGDEPIQSDVIDITPSSNSKGLQESSEEE